MKLVVFATALAIALFGCTNVTKVYRDAEMKQFRETSMAKASFVLSCPDGEVHVRLVPDDDAFPTSALVEGCGRKATFAKVQHEWVLEATPHP